MHHWACRASASLLHLPCSLLYGQAFGSPLFNGDLQRLLQDGVTVKKTTSALVIGIYGEGVQPADGNIVVENLADYLIGQGI